MQAIRLQDKRRSRRIRIGQPLKIRASDSDGATFEETNMTKNVSREGIYFVSQFTSYREGMRLYVTVPHHVPRDPQDREYLGQVVRVERLGEAQCGVAVQFLTEVKSPLTNR
ncbi:MAG TPA: PilZ domain-containing protein [Candidatus Acidoferrum sp.]|nr:PilZ domain-containing protein [Candidatus Acidoferrum sp.]